MSLLDKFNNLRDEAAKNMKKFANTSFMEAVLAICARVAAADGEIADSERKKVAAAIAKTEALQVFDASKLRDTFNQYCELSVDDFGCLELPKKVKKLSSNRDAAIQAVKIGYIIANADGTVDESEKTVLRQILKELGITADDAGLPI
ncbi:MAG: TerB family tellurite resistance protein [Leptolyngbya sp.]|nr:TerB family tellurite resistance protein [Candidatus Melainabacteria bacterium]